MLRDRRRFWGNKSGLLMVGLILGGLGLLMWMFLGSLDTEDPWLTPSEKTAVVVPNSAFTLKAGDRDSGLKEIRVAVNQG
ncbi:MAG: hypothetical protein WAU47_15745, partial [Desulfobaccales bacterium]